MDLMIAILAGALVLGGVFALFMRFTAPPKTEHTKKALQNITNVSDEKEQNRSIKRKDVTDSSTLKLIASVPGGKSTADLLFRAEMESKILIWILFSVVILIASPMLLRPVSTFIVTIFINVKDIRGVASASQALSIFAAIILALWLPRRYLKKKIQKRQNAFINDFPDALDMVVRSVQSGFPLTTAIQMIAENMDGPIAEEFQLVSEELSMGRTLNDVLDRLAYRVPEQDVEFFAVVLKVQQETGGNLGGIIANLAEVIRGRKTLRMKIKAITAEGKLTGWILAGMPLAIFFVLLYASPAHLAPFFETATGRMWLIIDMGLIGFSLFLADRLVKIDI